MKNLPSQLCTLLASLWISATLASAQTSPEVLEDGKVTFRVRAGDEAKLVKATGQFGAEVVMTKGEKGIWTGTTAEKVEPGVFEYSFKIDGVNVMDGRNASIKPQRWPGSSILHIPATPPAPWDLQDLPHGVLHHHTYHSKALNRWRKVVVYTPPNVGDQPLPVLYLSHGYSDNQDSWSEHGKAHWILDTLIHTGKAKPMLVVMPDAHSIEPGAERFDTYGAKNSTAFAKEMLEDVIPLVEASYAVQKDAAGRAFAGLSMGGLHALTIALKHSDRFSQIGAFSSATPSTELVEEAAKDISTLNEQLKVFWIACGNKDFLFEQNEELHAHFEKAGIKHDYEVTDGEDHSWPVWRRYLVTFTPKLFR